MSLDDLSSLTDAFGPGGGLLVALGMLAVGVLMPVLRQGRREQKPEDLVKDADVLVFMALHDRRMTDVERRLAKIEERKGD